MNITTVLQAVEQTERGGRNMKLLADEVRRLRTPRDSPCNGACIPQLSHRVIGNFHLNDSPHTVANREILGIAVMRRNEEPSRAVRVLRSRLARIQAIVQNELFSSWSGCVGG